MALRVREHHRISLPSPSCTTTAERSSARANALRACADIAVRDVPSGTTTTSTFSTIERHSNRRSNPVPSVAAGEHATLNRCSMSATAAVTGSSLSADGLARRAARYPNQARDGWPPDHVRAAETRGPRQQGPPLPSEHSPQRSTVRRQDHSRSGSGPPSLRNRRYSSISSSGIVGSVSPTIRLLRSQRSLQGIFANAAIARLTIRLHAS